MSCCTEAQGKNVGNQLLYTLFHDCAQCLAAFNGKNGGECCLAAAGYLG